MDTFKSRRIYHNPTYYVILVIPTSIGVLFCFLLSNPSTLNFRSWSSLRIRSSWPPYLDDQGDIFYHYEEACTIYKCKCNTHNHTDTTQSPNCHKCAHYMIKLKGKKFLMATEMNLQEWFLKVKMQANNKNRQLTVTTTLTITTNFTIGMQGITIMKGEFRVYQKVRGKHR